MSPHARSSRGNFRPDIQGLRALAVLAVILNHAGLPFVQGGYVGVDVFFVISGFLITAHLLRSLESDGRIGFAGFYARRARRILPAAFTVLGLSIMGTFVFVPPLLREQVFRDAVATAFYVPNYAFAVQGTDYLAETSPSVFQHYWSLGVEEQFYLLWPLLLLAIFLLVRRSRTGLVVTLAILVVGSFATCVVLTSHSQPWAFFSLWTRAWELGVGGLIAVIPSHLRLGPKVAAYVGWVGIGGIFAAAVLYSSATAFPGWAAALPVAAAGLVIFSGNTAPAYGPQALLGARPLQFLGLISYSLYLLHWPVLVLAQNAVGNYTPLPVWATTLLVVASIPLAWALYRFVENPARRASWLRRTNWRPLALAGIGSLVLAGVALGGSVATAALPLNAGRTTAQVPPTDPPVATQFVPSNLVPDLQHAADDNPAIYADGCEVDFAQTSPQPCFTGDPGGQRIVLFGDSHAAQWYPALAKFAKDNHLRLETETKSACPSVAVEVARNGVDYSACDTWRNNVISDLQANPPALVVIANYGNPEFNDKDNPANQWATGMKQTIGTLTTATKVVVIADTPDLRTSPIVCLSAHLTSAQSCGRPRSLALDSPGRIPGETPADLAGASFVDLTDYFCSATWCPAIVGDTLIYRDSHHITATYSTDLAAVLAPRLLKIIDSGS
jgi:peptidoglycan/LPS O-acetylase OafA/YrhL